MQARLGYAYFPYSLIGKQDVDVQAWSVHPACKTTVKETKNSGTISLLFDWYPVVGSPFHVTAGALMGASTMFQVTNTTALPSSYHTNGIDYYVKGDKSTSPTKLYTDPEGVYVGDLRRNAVRPFIGIGFGSPLAGKTVGFTFDIGVEYTGGVNLYTDPSASGNSNLDFRLDSDGIQEMFYDMRGGKKSKSYDKFIPYVDKLHDLPILPVLRLNIFFASF